MEKIKSDQESEPTRLMVILPSAKQSAACFFRVGMLDDVAVEMTSVVWATMRVQGLCFSTCS